MRHTGVTQMKKYREKKKRSNQSSNSTVNVENEKRKKNVDNIDIINTTSIMKCNVACRSSHYVDSISNGDDDNHYIISFSLLIVDISSPVYTLSIGIHINKTFRCLIND